MSGKSRLGSVFLRLIWGLEKDFIVLLAFLSLHGRWDPFEVPWKTELVVTMPNVKTEVLAQRPNVRALTQ